VSVSGGLHSRCSALEAALADAMSERDELRAALADARAVQVACTCTFRVPVLVLQLVCLVVTAGLSGTR
jgi:hypothetical protein